MPCVHLLGHAVGEPDPHDLTGHELLGSRLEQEGFVGLAHFGGFTYREVAAELGIPEGTEKSRVRSGLHRLATILGPTPGAVNLTGRDRRSASRNARPPSIACRRPPSFERSDRARGRTLTIGGDIAPEDLRRLESELAAVISEAHSPAFVDLSDVTFLDPAVRSVFVSAAAAGSAAGHPLVILNASPSLRRTLEQGGGSELFTTPG